MDGRSANGLAPVSPAVVWRMVGSASAIAASLNAGLPWIAGTNAQPAAPIPTIPIRIGAMREQTSPSMPPESKLAPTYESRSEDHADRRAERITHPDRTGHALRRADAPVLAPDRRGVGAGWPEVEQA